MNAAINNQTPIMWSVLCLDDEPSILRSLKRILPRDHYQVHLAESGHEALALMSETPIDLVISDMRMPEMSGAEFLEKVANQYPDTIRILLTGYSDIQSTIAAVNYGRIHRYVQKPWETQELLDCLDQELEKKRLKIENQRLVELVSAQNEELKFLNANLEKKVDQRTLQIKKALADLQKSHKQVKEQVRAIIRVFYNLLCLKGTHGSAYAVEISQLCLHIANQLDLTDIEIMNIKLAGLLNEVGVLCLEEQLVSKPLYHMSSEEFDAYKSHAQLAFKAMSPVQHLSSIAFSVSNQYERYDGKNNMSGKSGSEIPIGARILAIARDYIYAIHGVSSDVRLSQRGALDVLRQKADFIYDPDLVKHLEYAVTYMDIDQLEKNERVVSTPNLMSGMKLTRDVMTAAKILLLPEGHVLTSQTIKRIQSYVESSNEILRVYVLE